MENKANRMFPDTYDHSYNDFFNLYVNMDPSSFDNNKDLSFPSDLDQLFPLDPLPNDCGAHSPTISTPKRSRKTPQPCTKEVRCLQQETVSPAQQLDFVFHEPQRPATIPDAGRKQEASSRPAGQHKSLSTSQSTPPTTPRRKKGSKGAITTPKSTRYQDANEHCDSQRKQSFSPSLTSPSQMQKNSMAYTDAWGQRFHNFGIHPSNDRLPLSPPPSDILVQHEQIPVSTSTQMSRPGEGIPSQAVEVPPQYDSNIFSQSPAISMPSPSAEALARHQQRYFAHMNDSALPTPKPPSPDGIFSPPHSSDPQSMSQWNSAPLGTSPFFSPEFHNQDRAWWSQMPSRVPQRQQSYQSMVQSSAPASPFQNAGCQNDMSQGGLMIQFEPSFGMPTSTDSSFSMRSAPAAQESSSFSNMDLSTAPPSFTDSSFMTPMVHNPDARSPSLSPKSGVSPRSGHTGTPLKGHHRRNHSRKLSSLSTSAPKPATATGRSSTSPKGSSKSAPVSFVNFTASDSQKILTGVAPSGSSKTKARREQEARDRRRKLSEAALTAVRSAGGDVEALEAVLC